MEKEEVDKANPFLIRQCIFGCNNTIFSVTGEEKFHRQWRRLRLKSLFKRHARVIKIRGHVASARTQMPPYVTQPLTGSWGTPVTQEKIFLLTAFDLRKKPG